MWKKELFSSLDELVKSYVTFGNNIIFVFWEKVEYQLIKLKYECQNIILDVFYAPNIHHNLLSMRQLLEKGYNKQIRHRYCIMFDEIGRFIAKLKMTPNQFFIENST